METRFEGVGHFGQERSPSANAQGQAGYARESLGVGTLGSAGDCGFAGIRGGFPCMS